MTVYLVDMENIPHAWANLLDACGEDDRIVLFYTDRVSQVPIILMEKVTRAHVTMEYIKCFDGPNGLDFQLVTELGYRVAKDPSAEYAIVSQDHGFDVVVDYWDQRGVQAKRIVPSIAEEGGAFPLYNAGGGIEIQDVDFSNPESFRNFLYWRLYNKIPKREISSVAAIMLDAMEQGDGYTEDRRLSCRFTYLDRTLRKKYGGERGAKLRDRIKTVSHEVFVLNLTMDTEEPPLWADTGESEICQKPEVPQTPEDAVRVPLSALDLPKSKRETIQSIILDVLTSGVDRQKSAIYRRMLSAFGREDGTETYRAAKGVIETILSTPEITPVTEG